MQITQLPPYQLLEVMMDNWQDDPDFPVRDWKYEVANDDTRLGYHEWVARKREEAVENDALDAKINGPTT